MHVFLFCCHTSAKVSFGFVAGTGSDQVLAIAVTAVCVVLAVHFICKSAEIICGASAAYMQCFVVNVLFLSYYYSCTNFYTDIWVLLPIAVGFYMAALHEKTGKLCFVLVGALAWGVGSLFKMTALILPVAWCICKLLSEGRAAAKLRDILLMVAPLVMVMALFRLWYQNMFLCLLLGLRLP